MTITAIAPRLSLYEAMKVDLPEIDADGVRVRKFEIDAATARMSHLRAAIGGGRGRIEAGWYTRIDVDGTLWMSDTPDEIRDHSYPYWEAQRRGGRVLVNGLGLGMVVGALLKLENVEHIDVVELDPRIAEHVGQHYAGERCTIHVGNAYEMKWPVGTRWTVAWHDIWPDITGDNLPGMHRLHRMYGRRTDWQGSWARWECERTR